VNGRSYLPGDFILFKAGDTWIGSTFSRTLSPPSAGISGSQITYGKYGTGANPILDAKTAGVGARLHNYVTLTDFQIQNGGQLVDFSNTTGAIIRNITGKNPSVWGFRAGSNAGNTIIDHNSCTIETGHTLQGWCYQASGQGSIKITNNICNLQTGGACADIFGSSTSLIQGNISHGGSQAFSFKSMGGTKCTGPVQKGGLIADNYADGVSSASGDGEMIELTGCSQYPSSGFIVTRNVLICKAGGYKHGSTDAIGSFYAKNATITGNIILGDCGAYGLTNAPNLMHFSSYSSGMLVYNNTMYGSGRSDQVAVNVLPGSSATVKNNIIGNLGKGIYNQGGSASEDYNIYMPNVRTPYSGVSSGGHSKRSTDPKFVKNPPVGAADLKLQATSPAIRAGANLGLSFSSILNPLGLVPPFGTFDQSLGWMVGAFGYASPAAIPTFSPAGGTYSSPQFVSILDSSVGATIYYTTNGATPTTSSTVYTGPIAVSATTTIKALAAGSVYSAGGVGTATYTIQ
jgi:Chitobiase/beta-hexosaminidase C-terminal domain